MNESREAGRIVNTLADIRVNPRVLAAIVFSRATDDITIRLYEFVTSLIRLWAGPGNVDSEKTEHIHKWARKANNV